MELLPTDPYVLIDPGIELNTKNPKKPPAPVYSRLRKLSYTTHFLTFLYGAAPYGPLYVLIGPGIALNTKNPPRNQPRSTAGLENLAIPTIF